MIKSSSLHPTPVQNQQSQFVKHVNDLSNDYGYQFEFFCDHCQKSFISTYIPAPSGKTYKPQGAGEKVKGFFGGIVREIGGIVENGFDSIGTNNANSQPNAEAILKSEREAAFAAAQTEASAMFGRCPKCGEWVCSDCWDVEAGTCSRCVREQSYIAAMGGAQPGMQQAGMGPQPGPTGFQPGMGVHSTSQDHMSFSQSQPQMPPAAGAVVGGAMAGAAGMFNASGSQQQPPVPATPQNPFSPMPQQVSSPLVECPSCHEMVPEMDFCGKCASSLTARPCPECGQLVEPKYPFCGWCGASLVKKPRVCPNCKQEVPDQMKFCPECGTKLDPADSPQEAKPAKVEPEPPAEEVVEIQAEIVSETPSEAEPAE